MLTGVEDAGGKVHAYIKDANRKGKTERKDKKKKARDQYACLCVPQRRRSKREKEREKYENVFAGVAIVLTIIWVIYKLTNQSFLIFEAMDAKISQLANENQRLVGEIQAAERTTTTVASRYELVMAAAKTGHINLTQLEKAGIAVDDATEFASKIASKDEKKGDIAAGGKPKECIFHVNGVTSQNPGTLPRVDYNVISDTPGVCSGTCTRTCTGPITRGH